MLYFDRWIFTYETYTSVLLIDSSYLTYVTTKDTPPPETMMYTSKDVSVAAMSAILYSGPMFIHVTSVRNSQLSPIPENWYYSYQWAIQKD